MDRSRYLINSCDLGFVLISVSPRGIDHLMLGDTPQELEEELKNILPEAERSELALSRKELDQIIRHIEDPHIHIHIPLDPQGSAFQFRVWDALQRIPVGHTVTYSALAERLGDIKSIRAVATACGDNPIAVLIPCHRVIRIDGGLGGYRWGIWRKQELLKREGNLLM